MAAEPSSGRLAAHLDTLLVVRSPAGDDGAAQEFRGSAYVLAHYSPYLRAALAKEWAQGDSKQVELTEHPQAFGHLLDFMHSMGNPDRLPSGECKLHVAAAQQAAMPAVSSSSSALPAPT